MSSLTRRVLLVQGLLGAAALPALAQGYGQMGGDGRAGTASGQDASVQGDMASVATVTIRDRAFNPPSLTVAVGQPVRFVNEDGVTHTITADDGAFDVEDMTPGRAVRLTFPAPGTYAYHCEIHPMMTGTLTIA
ncbi:Copper binding protein, plastocyanin/azurin family [Rubellimicrobium mesophilum DSM 19309]|uniref:Copper binding protein, plastocyanin/azurin family n=1 Tax=Rubellimicrobium mesophilum DSM 19309 TaxID=442562 RepID=A0A017HMR5_9RHOB|nr:cupredoxin family copper-binding protein [Rubellimicrobium mesophilum]EYD75039.1 Copper binding protein, plastocyanin/azurin family [Rubellimicrobium mesophilum DSM 19309]